MIDILDVTNLVELKILSNVENTTDDDIRTMAQKNPNDAYDYIENNKTALIELGRYEDMLNIVKYWENEAQNEAHYEAQQAAWYHHKNI